MLNLKMKKNLENKIEKILIKGNDAVVEAALRSGLNGFFGYPITPASEIIEGFAKAYYEDLERKKKGLKPKYPEFQVFLQMESEIASINAALGGAATGKRVLTASSSPGISLKQEGISYIAGCELPVAIIDVMRGGPGLGNIAPEQGDYFQTVKGGGHGDYRLITLAPNSVQELAEFTCEIFELADKYRNPAVLLYDGYLGQMKEGVIFPKVKAKNYDRSSWAADGNKKGREKHIITSIYIAPEDMEKHKLRLKRKYDLIEEKEVRFENYKSDDADIVIVAYGIVSRIAKDVVEKARKEGIKVGLLRPITLWPFPKKEISQIADNAKAILTVELNMLGQMNEDVLISANGKCPVEFYGRCGGVIPKEKEILEKILEINRKVK